MVEEGGLLFRGGPLCVVPLGLPVHTLPSSGDNARRERDKEGRLRGTRDLTRLASDKENILSCHCIEQTFIIETALPLS